MKESIIVILILLASHIGLANELKLSHLGFNDTEIKINPKLELKLKERKRKLEIHQYAALTALTLMTGAVLTSGHGESTETHKWLGIAGGAAYYTAAYYSLTAPEIEGIEKSGNTKWHKRLAWIHGPAMILAPILGHLANEKYRKGEQPDGIVQHHNAIAYTAYFSFLAAAMTMTFEF